MTRWPPAPSTATPGQSPAGSGWVAVSPRRRARAPKARVDPVDGDREAAGSLIARGSRRTVVEEIRLDPLRGTELGDPQTNQAHGLPVPATGRIQRPGGGEQRAGIVAAALKGPLTGVGLESGKANFEDDGAPGEALPPRSAAATSAAKSRRVARSTSGSATSLP